MRDDNEQQRQEFEQWAYLRHSLNALKEYISAETFQSAERELGFNQNEESSYGRLQENRSGIRRNGAGWHQQEPQQSAAGI